MPDTFGPDRDRTDEGYPDAYDTDTSSSDSSDWEPENNPPEERDLNVDISNPFKGYGLIALVTIVLAYLFTKGDQ